MFIAKVVLQQVLFANLFTSLNETLHFMMTKHTRDTMRGFLIKTYENPDLVQVKKFLQKGRLRAEL